MRLRSLEVKKLILLKQKRLQLESRRSNQLSPGNLCLAILSLRHCFKKFHNVSLGNEQYYKDKLYIKKCLEHFKSQYAWTCKVELNNLMENSVYRNVSWN